MRQSRVKKINPKSDARWDGFVEAQAGTIYHHSDWLGILEATYGFTPFHLASEEEDGTLMGVLPLFLIDSKITGKRLISLPFSPYGGPLTTDDDAQRHLMEECIKIADSSDADHVALRAGRTLKHSESFGEQRYYRSHVLDLNPGINALMSGLHSSCIRRPLKRALDSELTLRLGSSEEDLRAFYRLQVLTRKKHGIPPQPLAYFENMWRALHPRGWMELLLAESEGATAAAIIILKFGDRVVYQNGASDPRFLGQKPNHLLLWKAIETAKSEGFRWFDFGTSTPEDKGLIQFKRRWGTEESTLPHYFYPESSASMGSMESSTKYRIASKIFHHLPAPILRKIGEVCYRHVA